ncbi:MAG: hypothetical protein HYW57_03985 [Ignavibacteriales bacterium]|nr:hypothetical protein [Ignavibacteriales bacterium]
MNKNEIHCAHACRNTCAMLVQALGEERKLADFYRQVAAECDYPDVQAVLTEVRTLQKRTVILLEEKLSEMQARGEVLDSVQASFDPAGC